MPKRERSEAPELVDADAGGTEEEVKPQTKRQKEAHESAIRLISVYQWLNQLHPVASGMTGLALASAPKKEGEDDPLAVETIETVSEAFKVLSRTLSVAVESIDFEFKTRTRTWINTHEEEVED